MISKCEAFDVVIIGSGGAGLRSAVSSAEKGAKTLIIAKGKINRSGSTLLAGANISADIACDGRSLYEMGITDMNKDDSKEKFFADICHEGFYLGNQELIKLFCEGAPERIRELMSWGMKVLGTEGERGISVFGSAILDSLFKRVKELGVSYIEDHIFTDIVTENKKVKGVVCVDILTGEIKFYPARAVIIATGGSHGLFPENSGPTDCCAEGPAAALRAGAELTDMEMISFCPSVILNPRMYKGNILPYILNTLGYGHYLNKFGKTFTHRHLSPEVEALALDSEWNKMLLSYAIQKEINSSRGNRYGGVYFKLDLDPVELREELYRDLPGLKNGIYCDIMDLFLKNHAVTIAPFAHYFEGGIKINTKMETRVEGLFAAGEVTGGMFGANRVSAATTEMLIEGNIAGNSAALFASENDPGDVSASTLSDIESDLMLPFNSKGDLSPVSIRQELHSITSSSLMVIRNGTRLEKAFADIMNLRNSISSVSVTSKYRRYNKEWMEYLFLRNGLITASAIIKSALSRKESRGVHVREDHLYTDNINFLKNCVVTDTDINIRWSDPVNTEIKPEPICKDYISYVEDIIKKLS